MKKPVLLCLLMLLAMPPCRADTASLESLLLSSSPALTLDMKGDFGASLSLLLGQYPEADQTFIKSQIVCTEAAKKSPPLSHTPLVTSKNNPLAITIHHLLELYACKQTFQEGLLHIEAIHESKGEFETRKYYLSPALLHLVLGKDAPKEIPAQIPWEKLNARLNLFGLQIMDMEEHPDKIMLQGETAAHERFNAELTLLLFRTIDADIESRITRLENPPGK